MSRIGFDIDVHKNDVADKVKRRIEAGVEGSVDQRNSESIGRYMSRAARQHINRHGRVWTTELIRSFDIRVEEVSGNAHLVLIADAEHASTVDTGAQYDAEGPPLHRLIPWVEAKLKGYRVKGDKLVKYSHDEGGQVILTDGSGYPRGSTTRVLPPEEEVESVERLHKAGVAGGTNEADAKWLTYEDGSHAYFEEYKMPPAPTSGRMVSKYGSVRNEKLYRYLSAEEDWRLAPAGRETEIIDPDDNVIRNGFAQKWIEDASPLSVEVPLPEHPDDYDATWDSPTEFVEENTDFLAKMTALDIIVGNSDRHGENMIIDGDGNLHAIDNGGVFFAPDDTLGAFIRPDMVGTSFRNIKEFDEWPGLEDAYIAFLDQQLIYLREFLENHRQDIYMYINRIFSRDRQVRKRIDRLVGRETDDIMDMVRQRQDEIVSQDRVGIDTIDNILEDEDITEIDDIKEELDKL